MLQFLPYALAAIGGYKGYKDSKDQGISGINRLLNTAAGATIGYTVGSYVPGVKAAGFGGTGVGAVPTFTQLPGIRSIPGIGAGAAQTTINPKNLGVDKFGNLIPNRNFKAPTKESGSLLDILRKKKDGKIIDDYDPMKVSLAAAGIPFALGAFDTGPTDVFSPGYNVGYAQFAAQRPGFTYIDPQTGQERPYENVYIPEADPANQGEFRSGPYSMNKTRLKTGGLAEIKKFNEGGVNYLPSKISHDENDSNNYVRAHGYVEDGSGAGDKDEDTMLAQLADGEFVTRADGVLGAGIIAGANPNSIKDMREKGAQYFYDQQARYKRVFDLLKEKNGDSKQKTN